MNLKEKLFIALGDANKVYESFVFVSLFTSCPLNPHQKVTKGYQTLLNTFKVIFSSVALKQSKEKKS